MGWRERVPAGHETIRQFTAVSATRIRYYDDLFCRQLKEYI